MSYLLRPRLIAAAAVLSLAACAPPPVDYTNAEAPNELVLTDASSTVGLRFAPGSDRLLAGEAARLANLVARGVIDARDRVTIAAAGSPALAERRAGTIAGILLHYGIVATARPLGPVARDHAAVSVDRYLTTLPPCPNWSKPAAADFTNTLGSNFGCATATNLGRTVANPADLASGRPLGPADGTPAVAAVQRYMADKVVLPAANTALPIATPSSAAPGSGGGNP